MIDEFQQMSNRRSMISRSSALMGACLLATVVTPAKAQSAGINNDDPVDVKNYDRKPFYFPFGESFNK